MLAGLALGIATMVTLGVALGLVRTARSAQALGLLAFLPRWLLGAGGPPRSVMPQTMGSIADFLPLGHAAAAMREACLGTGDATSDLAALTGWLIASAVVVALLLRQRTRHV